MPSVTRRVEDETLPVDMVLTNAKIFFWGKIVEAGLALNEGKIVEIAKESNLPPASTKLDLQGHLALPGIIDPHVHLRDQQLAYKETFFSGTAAAAAGGVTLVVDMPNNKPVTMDPNSLKERMKLAESQAVINIAFNSAFPEDPRQIASIVKEGAVGFKLYLSERIGGLDIENDSGMLHAFSKIREVNFPVAVHAEDRGTIERLKQKMENANRNNLEAYVEAHPPEAEAKAIQRVTRLAKKSGIPFHICHISSKRGFELFLKAKNDGLSVTCEVTPHHLLLSSEDLKRCGPLALTNPPLRPRKATEYLWKELQRGFIDVLASDHAPHAVQEKSAESAWEIKPGIAGLETLLPLLLTQVNANRLTIRELVNLTAKRPAQIFNLKNRGSLKKGNYADIVIVDLKREYTIDSSKFYSKAKYSPFDGWKVKGRPVKTFVNGKLVMDQGEIIVKPGTGDVIRPHI